jgi:hypothetical protein
VRLVVQRGKAGEDARGAGGQFRIMLKNSFRNISDFLPHCIYTEKQ